MVTLVHFNNFQLWQWTSTSETQVIAFTLASYSIHTGHTQFTLDTHNSHKSDMVVIEIIYIIYMCIRQSRMHTCPLLARSATCASTQQVCYWQPTLTLYVQVVDKFEITYYNTQCYIQLTLTLDCNYHTCIGNYNHTLTMTANNAVTRLARTHDLKDSAVTIIRVKSLATILTAPLPAMTATPFLCHH